MIMSLWPAIPPLMQRGKTEVTVCQEGLQVELRSDRYGSLEHTDGGFEVAGARAVDRRQEPKRMGLGTAFLLHPGSLNRLRCGC